MKCNDCDRPVQVAIAYHHGDLVSLASVCCEHAASTIATVGIGNVGRVWFCDATETE